MKPIENIDLAKAYSDAQAEVLADLHASVVAKIKAQLMANAQLRIKAANSTAESDKLKSQLAQKEALVSRIVAGDWGALPDTAKERDDAAQKADANA